MLRNVMFVSRRQLLWALSLGACLAAAVLTSTGCEQPSPRERLRGQVALTLLHTSDMTDGRIRMLGN